MLISDKKKSQQNLVFLKSKNFKIISVLTLIALILLAYFLLKPSTYITFPGKVICDLETLEGENFITDGHSFKTGKKNLQSKDWSYSGKNSLKLNSDNQFGLQYAVYNPKPGEVYKATVWVHRPHQEGGAIVASSPNQGKSLYIASGETKRKHIAWELLEIKVIVPKNYTQNRIDFYLFNAVRNVYFDDFTIEKVTYQTDFKSPELRLYVADKWMNRLEAKRTEAINVGLLVTEDDDWVEGEIKAPAENIDIELRLKGDWLDHLLSEKWSYRMKVKGDKAWNRLKTFSIQRPETRNYLGEWLFHKMLEDVDVLTPRYDFLTFYQNDINKGVYAYEEHFDKQLAEYKKRREGPIVKFDESIIWLITARVKQMYKTENDFRMLMEARDAGTVLPFKEGRTQKSETLSMQFEEAQKLMQQFRFNTKPFEEIFDLDVLARYYAIVDIMSAYHGATWANSRFYYNPVTSKLEPIGYDGYSADEETLGDRTFLGEGLFNQNHGEDKISLQLFKNTAFMEYYTKYIVQYSDKAYFENYIRSIDDAMRQRQNLLQIDYPDYEYNYSKLFAHVRDIRAIVMPFGEYAIQAFTENTTKDQKELSITNFHKLPLRVIGFGQKKGTIIDSLKNEPLLEVNVKRLPPTYRTMKTTANMKYLFYELPGLDSVFTVPISNWKSPQGATANQKIFDNINLVSNDLYEVNGDKIYFKKGNHTITKDIIIPANYYVIFPAGIQLNFINKAKFVSKSAVSLIGTTDEPILIYSADKSANGFTVLQAKATSKVAYTVFRDFNTLITEGWKLTGAVTFYETTVDINNARFIKNHCEDGLNIIRSNFKLNHITIGETFSDGLDIDFSEGIIKNATFYKTGNDGMDFSGSTITVLDSKIETAGDKGISVGEQSYLFVNNVKIDGANIACASKDLSKLNIVNIDIKNCNQGFIAFQKKPEYGGAKIIVKNYTAENIKYLHQIQLGSFLQLKEEIIEGK
jgi:hypothetical protein